MQTTFLDAYKKLNTAQKLAVDSIYGPVMVVAGPGTGKTQVLTLRIAKIIASEAQASPKDILCLTFTNAGVRAIRERLHRLNCCNCERSIHRHIPPLRNWYYRKTFLLARFCPQTRIDC